MVHCVHCGRATATEAGGEGRLLRSAVRREVRLGMPGCGGRTRLEGNEGACCRELSPRRIETHAGSAGSAKSINTVCEAENELLETDIPVAVLFDTSAPLLGQEGWREAPGW